jgi:hypothetical protein
MVEPMHTAPLDGTQIIVYQSGLRFRAEYDDDAGYFFALEALDGLPTEYTMEIPGRLYSPTGYENIG